MTQDYSALIAAIRDRFAHVDSCPFQGPRIYLENGGGALTLKSVVETSAIYAAIPDNQGRDNPGRDGTVSLGASLGIQMAHSVSWTFRQLRPADLATYMA